MKLQELLKGVAVKSSTAAEDMEIKEVRYDSRAVQPGDLFVAIRGYATDGHQYIGKALEQGASSAAAAYTPLRSPTPVSITPQIMPPIAESPAPRAISAAAIARPKGA